MTDDPIVDAIRRVRRAHAAAFDNDLAAIIEDLRRLERESGRSYVNFSPRSPEGPAAPPRRDSLAT